MVELEPFSEHMYGSLRQARGLKHLVEKERSWLRAVQPGTYDRYQSMLDGAKNIIRIAGHRHDPEQAVEASVIRRGHTALGIATIIHNQQIVHPEFGTFTGHDVDYWLRLRESPETHEEIAKQLLSHVSQTAILAVVEDHPNPPVGLTELMSPVGHPVQLEPGDREDVFDVARKGIVSQLYVFPAR